MIQGRRLPAILGWLLLAALAGPISALAQPSAQSCGSLVNAYGPLDYRTQRGNSLYLVEIAHFTPEVEALLRGRSGYLGGDLDYTLRAYPNHHRALLSLVKWGERTKSPQPNTLPRSIECYFERAIRFQHDDMLVRLIYATFLANNNRVPDADRQLQIAAASAADNPFTHYNIGLLYLDMKEYDKALQHAQIAYRMGFGQPALRDGLKAAGKWIEPPADSASAAASDVDRGSVPPTSTAPAASAAQ